MHAPVPVVDFRIEEESGHAEWWKKIVHPRLVGAGREEVMRHVVEWIYHEVTDMAADLADRLRKLKVLREADALKIGWPEGETVSGPAWDVDPDDSVPCIGNEKKIKTARERFGNVD